MTLMYFLRLSISEYYVHFTLFVFSTSFCSHKFFLHFLCMVAFFFFSFLRVSKIEFIQVFLLRYIGYMLKLYSKNIKVTTEEIR